MWSDLFTPMMARLISRGIVETLYMTIISTFMAYVIGLPLGILLVATDEAGIKPYPVFCRALGSLINTIRSVPFLILLVAVIPVTRAIAGTTIGANAIIVPLVISAGPFVARIVEGSLREVDAGVIEAAQAMGASPMQIVLTVMLPEALPSLIMGAAVSITAILGYSAMAGIVGASGLGAIAITYGYYRKRTDIMFVMVVLLIVLVQLFQEVGDRLSVRTDKRVK